MPNTGHFMYMYVQMTVVVLIEGDIPASFCEVIFILLVQTTNLLQDKQSRMDYDHVVSTYMYSTCPYQSSRLAFRTKGKCIQSCSSFRNVTLVE